MLLHLFLSPHFDDAVGSCGGTIRRLVSGGHAVRALTVFGGSEREPFSIPARILHGEWKLKRPVEARRVEDASAFKILGCESSFLDFTDAIYRQDADGGHLYSTFESLRGPIVAQDCVLAERFGGELNHYLSHEEAIVYCPLAVGSHVDHVIVRDCWRTIEAHNSSVVFYRDFYYDQHWSNEAAELVSARVNVTLTNEECSKKIAAFSEYKSQISDLFETRAGMISYFSGIGRVESYFLRRSVRSHWATLRSVLGAKGVTGDPCSFTS